MNQTLMKPTIYEPYARHCRVCSCEPSPSTFARSRNVKGLQLETIFGYSAVT
jgi:hypothetical protein